VFLVFIGLDSGELAVARVIERVEAGGHDVPDEKVLSRFPRTLDNLTQALEFVDHAFVFDNSSADEPFRFVAEFAKGILVRRGTCRPTWAIPLLKRFSKKRR
jgi:predicted ABC-type ATPase